MNYRKQLTLAAGAMLGLFAMQAQAQQGEPTVNERLRECGRIADVPARVACYDAIPTDGPQPSATRPEGEARPAGFGSRQLAARSSREEEAAEADAIEATVAAAAQREPGIHLLTLEDGAQWLFIEGVRPSYNPPRRGSKVEIRNASLGSYLLRFQDQPAVRVRRVR